MMPHICNHATGKSIFLVIHEVVPKACPWLEPPKMPSKSSAAAVSTAPGGPGKTPPPAWVGVTGLLQKLTFGVMFSYSIK